MSSLDYDSKQSELQLHLFGMNKGLWELYDLRVMFVAKMHQDGKICIASLRPRQGGPSSNKRRFLSLSTIPACPSGVSLL